MVSNGFSLSGVALAGQTSRSAGKTAMLEGGVQRVTTEVDYGSYEAITVQKQVPVEWTVIVPEGKLNGCNGEIRIPAYDLTVTLHEGENLISFTPETEGVIPYSCWMGMIKSSIRVLD